MRQHLHLDPVRKEMLALKECNVPKYFFKFCLADYSCFGYIPWSEAECLTIFLVLLSCGIFFVLYISNDFMASQFFNYTVKICSYLLIADKCR